MGRRAAQAVFSAADARTALARHKKYVRGANFFWQDFLSSASPGAPMDASRVQDLAEFVFADGPSHLPWMLVMRVPSPDYDILSHRGSLQRLSPEEAPRAVLFRCAADLASTGSEQDDPLAQHWLSVLLSVTFCFEVVPNESDMFWKAVNLRGQVSADYVAMRRTARQLVHELAGFKAMMEGRAPGTTLTPKDVAAMFLEKSRVVKDGGEEFSPTFVQNALYVHDSVCTETEPIRVMEFMETKYGLQSCFNSITKLYEISKRSGDCDSRAWVFHGILDLIRDGKLSNDDVSKTLLVGNTHAVGLVQLLLFKRRLLNAFLNTELPRAGFSHEDLELIRAALCCHEAFRTSVAGFGSQDDVDAAWIGRMRDSSVKAMRLIEVGRAKFCPQALASHSRLCATLGALIMQLPAPRR